jgi:hypothetical protein
MRSILLPALLIAAWASVVSAESPAVPVIAVVVGAGQVAESVDAETVALIFKRRKQLWSDGRRIVAVNLPADHPLRRRFSRAILGLSPESLEDYWNEQYFHGVMPPHVLASETAVARFVAETRGAIGYLPYCGLDAARVQVLLLIDAQGRALPATDAAATRCDAPMP